ncbi:predicted protein [Arabidopsis lyrata subsp. lyrata]|uniref:Predicted protein n=1 Tax=Arabidopsis lyrata subsp. lyrata TaxID=81972 RepID=D7L3B9_ARALL|nr:predicted protein [Arabidopsis lyrata subsp. lyrata]
MGIRESTALGWPLFTSVGDFHGRQLRWRFHLVLVVLNSIGNNIDLLWTKMVWCGGVGDRLLGLMEFLITNRSVGLSTAMGYAAMDVASLLMHESQQVSLFRRRSTCPCDDYVVHSRCFSGYARRFRSGDNNCRQRFSENLQSSMHMGSRNYIEGICREDLQRRLWCGMYNRMGLHRYQAKLFAS